MSKVALRTLDALENKTKQMIKEATIYKNASKGPRDGLLFAAKNIAYLEVIYFINELREGLQKD